MQKINLVKFINNTKKNRKFAPFNELTKFRYENSENEHHHPFVNPL